MAAAVAVYVQLKDINDRDKEEKIKDWQNAAVYRIIESSRSPIGFQDVSLRYTAEAQKFPAGVPREKLDDPHLQLVLIRLIQSQSIVQPYSGTYSVRTYRELDPKELYAVTTKLTNDATRQFASHIQLGIEQLSQANAPLTPDQLLKRMTAVGGDTTYLKDNFPILLQQMSTQGQLKFLGDGRITAGSRMEGTTTVVPPAEVSQILPKIRRDMMQFIITNRPGTGIDQCYYDKNPSDLQDGGLFKDMADLGLVTLAEIKALRVNNRPCAVGVHVELTNLSGGVSDYYFAYLQVLMK